MIVDKGSVERWEVCWNTGCCPRRVPEARYHATLWAAIEAAQPKQPCRACGPHCTIWQDESVAIAA